MARQKIMTCVKGAMRFFSLDAEENTTPFRGDALQSPFNHKLNWFDLTTATSSGKRGENEEGSGNYTCNYVYAFICKYMYIYIFMLYDGYIPDPSRSEHVYITVT